MQESLVVFLDSVLQQYCTSTDPASGATAFSSCVQAATTIALALLTAIYVVIYAQILSEMRWPEPQLFDQSPSARAKRLSDTSVKLTVSYVVWNVGNGAAKMLEPSIRTSLGEVLRILEFSVPSIVPSHVAAARMPVTFYAQVIVTDAETRKARLVEIAMPYENVRGKKRRVLRLKIQCAFDKVPGLAIGQVWEQIPVLVL